MNIADVLSGEGTPIERMALVVEATLKMALDNQIDEVRDDKYRKGDYFGVLQVSIVGHAELTKEQKRGMLDVLDNMEYDMYQATNKLDPNSPPRAAYLKLAMDNHMQFCDTIDKALEQINKRVANIRAGIKDKGLDILDDEEVIDDGIL